MVSSPNCDNLFTCKTYAAIEHGTFCDLERVKAVLLVVAMTGLHANAL